MADVILLHGASSSGKTTLARAIQDAADRPMLHLASDFVGIGLPARREDEGPFRWTGGWRPRYFDGFQRSIAAYADAGVDLVVDHVIESASWRSQLRRLLAGHTVCLVGVHCDLDEIDRRERARGDRRPGEGRTHVEVDRIHAFGPYDVEVDTTGGDHGSLAGEVLAALAAGRTSALRSADAGIVLSPATAGDGDVMALALLAAMNWNGEQRRRLEDVPGSAYLAGWPRAGDAGVVARTEEGEPVGAAWYRLLRAEEHGYGWIADDVPEVTIGLVPGFRGAGTGTRLLGALIDRARSDGVRALSLSVEDGNRARRLYERSGFRTVGRNGGSDTLLLPLG